MQTKITFAGGTIGGGAGTTLGTLNHENMHQWFGDNVAEGAFELTFWKEGFARVGEYLNAARAAAGGGFERAGVRDQPHQPVQHELRDDEHDVLDVRAVEPDGRQPVHDATSPTRGPARPTSALWQALGRDRMISAMKDIQSTYGGRNINESQLKEVFRTWLPSPTASCGARLDQYFTEWFDTSYPTGGANTTNKPKLSGPGLNGTGFVCAAVTPASPDGKNGWYTGAGVGHVAGLRRAAGDEDGLRGRRCRRG